MNTLLAQYWDRYATGLGARQAAENPDGDHRFEWTQYPGHGPGDELLEQPATSLELGSGRGRAVAYLARKGVKATGIDLSPIQCENARQQWGDVPGATFVQAEALTFLSSHEQSYDAIYSVWGCLWFSDPETLLPLVRTHLNPSGTVAFSHAPAVPGSYGVQGMYGEGFTGRQLWVHRWAYPPEAWAEILHRHGFTHIEARILDAPDPANVGTLIVRAKA